MRPDLVSLALFIRVAELQSITKAAEASHIALAAASRRITQLEDQLGVQLLFRSARGVDLTPAGTTLLAHARDARQGGRDARRDRRLLARPERSRPGAGQCFRPRAIPAGRPGHLRRE